MKPKSVVIGVLIVAGGSTPALGQPNSQPHNIPLQFVDQYYRLGINVGIAGNAPRLYLFDTGSSSFNAVTNSSILPLSGVNNGSLNANGGPSTNGLTTNAYFGYNTGGLSYIANMVQVPSLEFFDASSKKVAQVVTSLGSPGFEMGSIVSRVEKTYNNNQLVSTTTDTFSLTGAVGTPACNTTPAECYSQTTTFEDPKKPPINATYNISQAPEPSVPGGVLYGTFGAGYFQVPIQTLDSAGKPVANGQYNGGILGQAQVSATDVKQGYMVAANGQQNPFSTVNAPQQPAGIAVTIGGKNNVPVTDCSPCVTLGLSPQVLGQFMPISSANTGSLMGWTANSPGGNFANPYGGATGNNAGVEFGIRCYEGGHRPG